MSSDPSPNPSLSTTEPSQPVKPLTGSHVLDPSKMPIVFGGIPPVWIDEIHMSVRSDLSLAQLRFISWVVPDERVEVGRYQTSMKHLNQFVRTLCEITGIYPERPEPAATPTPGAEPPAA